MVSLKRVIKHVIELFMSLLVCVCVVCVCVEVDVHEFIHMYMHIILRYCLRRVSLGFRVWGLGARALSLCCSPPPPPPPSRYEYYRELFCFIPARQAVPSPCHGGVCVEAGSDTDAGGGAGDRDAQHVQCSASFAAVAVACRRARSAAACHAPA
jgi:hypothetical protein